MDAVGMGRRSALGLVAAGACGLAASASATSAAASCGTEHNLYLGSFFTSQSDSTVNLFTSDDGISFVKINDGPMPSTGAGPTVSQRDPAITWFQGQWYIFGTGAAEGNHDFVVYRSDDLRTWVKYQVALGGGPYYSATIPFPGASVPASAIWAPEPFIDDGTLFVIISIRFGANYIDAYGNDVMFFRTFVAECLDAETLTFGEPQAPEFPGIDLSLIDMSIGQQGSRYLGAVKDDGAKNILICEGTDLLGPWHVAQVVGDPQFSIEGPCLYRSYEHHRGAVRATWRLCVDNNRTGPDSPDPDVLVGAPYYFQSLGASPHFGAMRALTFDHPVRHGSIINLADFPPAATVSLQAAVAAN